MGPIKKVIRFDLTSMPDNQINQFYDHLVNCCWMTDDKKDPKRVRYSHITAFFENENVDAEKIIAGYTGVTYKDVTGTNLINPKLR